MLLGFKARGGFRAEDEAGAAEEEKAPRLQGREKGPESGAAPPGASRAVWNLLFNYCKNEGYDSLNFFLHMSCNIVAK